MNPALQQLSETRAELANEIAQTHFARHPELDVRYGPAGRKHCARDAAYHLQYLEQALRVDSDGLFADYARWAKIMLETRQVPVADLMSNLGTVAEVVGARYPDLSARVRQMVDAALASLDEAKVSSQSGGARAALADAYFRAVLDGDRVVASRLIHDAVESGVSLRDIYLEVFQPAQYEIGRLWQRNEIGVADEHLATAITQMIMSQLYPRLFAGPRKSKTFVSACVGGELHEIGARMVADFFEMDGWNTYYLGANTPLAGIVKTVQERRANVVGISVTISYHVGEAESVIKALREVSDARIIVGGYPFLVAPDLWKTIGADGSAPDAKAAIALANSLAGVRST